MLPTYEGEGNISSVMKKHFELAAFGIFFFLVGGGWGLLHRAVASVTSGKQYSFYLAISNTF